MVFDRFERYLNSAYDLKPIRINNSIGILFRSGEENKKSLFWCSIIDWNIMEIEKEDLGVNISDHDLDLFLYYDIAVLLSNEHYSIDVNDL